MTRLVLAAWLAVAAVGCGRDRSDGGDSGLASDSTLFGDDRASRADSQTVPDVALLEQLIDQYEELDVVMDALAGPESGSAVQGKAWKGNRHEDAAKGRLLDLLRTEFGERYQPKTPAGAAERTDSIASLPREAGMRELNVLVLDHHQRVAREIQAALSGVRSRRVRDALAELHASLAKEIEQLGGRPAPAM